jgi:hypothetical protein
MRGVRDLGHDAVRGLGSLMAVGVALVAAGCGVIPTSGPGKIDIAAGQTDPASVDYGLVKITSEVVQTLAH